MTAVNEPSTAYKDMLDDWRMIAATLAGAKAIRKGGTTYLPQYPAETPAEYQRRLASAPWRPEFEDALRSIVAKPFANEVAFQGDVSDQMKVLSEDIDGRGNNLNAFARGVFRDGVALGMAGVLVDYPAMAPGMTLAQERSTGARPYWVPIRADEILALYTENVGGREIVSHLRLVETVVERDGYGERSVTRVRVLEPGRWELWESDGKRNMQMVAEGVVTLPEVPFAMFWTGERSGSQYVRPPLLNLAEMQKELYQALSRQDEILTFAGSPMLAAKGLAPSPDGVAVGPKRILYAPPGADNVQTGWDFIQPAAENIKEVREHVESIVADMRRLGMQPMLPKTGGVSATASAVDAAKAHSSVEAWAVGLKDVLEQAFVFTAQWLKTSEAPEVYVHTDFGAGEFSDTEVRELSAARTRGDISQKTYWDEMRRRGILGPQFDPEQEEDRLAEEDPGEDEILAAAMLPAQRQGDPAAPQGREALSDQA